MYENEIKKCSQPPSSPSRSMDGADPSFSNFILTTSRRRVRDTYRNFAISPIMPTICSEFLRLVRANGEYACWRSHVGRPEV
jgi:hypothetical protein